MEDAGTALVARDLGQVLHRTVRDGAAYEAGVLPRARCRAVLEEVADETFADLPPLEGPYGVRQEGEHRIFVREPDPDQRAGTRQGPAWGAEVAPPGSAAPDVRDVPVRREGRALARVGSTASLMFARPRS